MAGHEPEKLAMFPPERLALDPPIGWPSGRPAHVVADLVLPSAPASVRYSRFGADCEWRRELALAANSRRATRGALGLGNRLHYQRKKKPISPGFPPWKSIADASSLKPRGRNSFS